MIQLLREAKIRDNHRPVALHEEVATGDVAVHDPPLIEIHQARAHVSSNAEERLAAPHGQVMQSVKAPRGAILDQKPNLGCAGDHADKSDNVRVGADRGEGLELAHVVQQTIPFRFGHLDNRMPLLTLDPTLEYNPKMPFSELLEDLNVFKQIGGMRDPSPSPSLNRPPYVLGGCSSLELWRALACCDAHGAVWVAADPLALRRLLLVAPALVAAANGDAQQHDRCCSAHHASSYHSHLLRAFIVSRGDFAGIYDADGNCGGHRSVHGRCHRRHHGDPSEVA
mmetsp:Transcript_10038/g.19602  ORF Transcript_10038/g.19602 Transcript_10038/m.19602 type:complete len:282 (+) Transcript_10038:772-1617(+)